MLYCLVDVCNVQYSLVFRLPSSFANKYIEIAFVALSTLGVRTWDAME
jgi:hypothetical protein